MTDTIIRLRKFSGGSLTKVIKSSKEPTVTQVSQEARTASRDSFFAISSAVATASEFVPGQIVRDQDNDPQVGE